MCDGKWSTIDTAPKDGTPIVIWLDDEGFWVVARHTFAADEGSSAWFIQSMDEYAGADEIHSVSWWLPISPPSEAEGGS